MPTQQAPLDVDATDLLVLIDEINGVIPRPRLSADSHRPTAVANVGRTWW
jgi:hypothetical protein